MKQSENNAYSLEALRYIRLQTTEDFCQRLHTNPTLLLEGILGGYHLFERPKKSEGQRIIHRPNNLLKEIQKKWLNILNQLYCKNPHQAAHGFIQNKFEPRNIKTNALVHVGSECILSMDIKDFFTSITSGQVYELFKRRPFLYSHEVARTATLISCYNGHLPTGAPSSPIISNMICWPMDENFKKICDQRGIKYTRYADDLTFSGTSEAIQQFKSVIPEILNQHGFQLNHLKTRIRVSSQRQMVTGLIVNKYANIPREYLKKTRAMCYDLRTNGPEIASARHYSWHSCMRIFELRFLRMLMGRLSFIAMVKGENYVREDQDLVRSFL